MGIRSGISEFWQRELALTQGSFIHEMGSFASNLGFTQRQIQTGGGATTSAVMFGNKIRGNGALAGQYVFTQGKGAQQVFRSFDDIGTGLAWAGKENTALRRGMHRMGLRGAGWGATMNLGFTSLLAVGDAIGAAKRGEGFVGSVGAGMKSFAVQLLQQRALSMALTNPIVGGLALAGGAAAIGISTVLKQKEQGNRYLRQTRQSELGGNISSAMHTRQAFTMRQRAMQSMQHSRFNAMRALGNEATFVHMPKARYGNSTHSVQPQPIMGY